MLEVENVWRKRVYFFFPKIEQKNFGTSDAIVEAVHSEMHSTYPDENIGGFCLSRSISSYFFLVFQRKKLVNWVRKCSSPLKTALYFCGILSSSFSSKFLGILKISEFERNVFGLIGETFFVPVQKFVGAETFQRKKIKFCQFLCTLCKRFSHIGQKLFRQCSRICIVRVQDKTSDWNFTWKKYFSTFSLKLSDKLSDF